MKSILITLLLAGNALAQINSPVLDEEIYSDNIHFKEVNERMFAFVPALFSQNFFCNEEKNVCTFQVYNQFNPAQELAVRTLRSGGFNTQSLRPDLFKQFVRVDAEELTGEMAKLQSSFMTMKNFAILEHAYGNSIFKPIMKASELLSQYEDEGLGSFNVQYTLTGVAKDFSIRMSTVDLKNLLEQKIGSTRLSFSSMREIVRKNLSLFRITGYLPEDAAVIVAHHIKERFMKSAGVGTVILDPDQYQNFQNEKLNKWVVAESLSSAKEICSITLPIKKNAIMQQECKVIREIQ